MLKLKRKSCEHSSQGFTFIEVLVGILIATAFVLVATQSLVIAAALRIKAQRQSEALNWIQNNLEGIQFRASLPISGSVTGITCNPTTRTSLGYAKGLISVVISPSTIASGDFAVTQTFNDSTTIFLNQSYTITRTLTVYNRVPYNVMQVSYSALAADGSTTTPIATLNTEVIPDESFNCF